MSFLAPLFLAGAAAAAVPIVLHLLRQHTERRVRFAAVSLLQGAPVEHAARRQLRQWLLLALRVAALVLMAFAFARPFFRSPAARGGRLTVIAIDTSLSMSTPAQVTRARQRAHDALRDAPSGDDVAVVTFDDRAVVALQPTPSRRLAASAIDAAAPGYRSTNYRAALAAAGELFRGRAGTIAIVTDLQANGWDAGGRAAVPDGIRVEPLDVGSSKDNIAVTDVRSDGDRVVATVMNVAAQSREVRATLTIDGMHAGTAVVQVGPNGTSEVVFSGIHAGGIAEVTVDDREGIAGDNSRYAFLDGTSGVAALVVTTNGDLEKDAWYVRHALSAGAAGTPRTRDVVGVSAVQLGTWTDDRLSRFAAVVVLSSRGLERRGRERIAAFVAAGGGLLVAAGPDVDGDVIADVLGAGNSLEVTPSGPQPLSLVPADARHPIFRPFGGEIGAMTLVRFRNAARVSGTNCEAIARFTSGDAAVLDCPAGIGRAVVVASDLDNRWNDFPIRASFVPFLDETVRYLSNARLRAAEYLTGEVPSGVPAVPGVVITRDVHGPRRVIVNVDPRESEVDRMSAADFETSVGRLNEASAREVRADVEGQESHQHAWQYLMAAVVLVLFAEGIVAARAV
ncbi:MAG TPA: BatA domain-containing protein [Vicinamibacterales bacterium]|nr:BatA domain-containing protein [Vicinamibacterales bacterium]